MALYGGAPYEYTAAANGLVFTAGACPLDEEGRVVEALAEAGARPADLLKTTIYVVADERSDLVRAWDTVSARLGRAPSTLLGVSFLGYPDQLVEIEAIAGPGARG